MRSLLLLLLLAPPPNDLRDEAPPPPPPQKPFSQRAMATVARFLRPALPEHYARGTDAQVCAAGAAGAGIGISGIVVFVIVLRILRRVPMSAVALVDAKRAKRLKSVGQRKGHLDQYLEALDLAAENNCSIHESLVVTGFDDLAIRALESAAREEERSRPKFPGWWIVLRAPGGAGEEALRKLRMRFAHEWLKARTQAAIAADPQLGRKGLTAEFMPGNDPWQIDFSFVAPSGLGATLETVQRAAWHRIRSAMEKARDHLGNPHALAAFSRALARNDSEQGFVDGVPVLDVLLFGASAIRRAGAFFTGHDHCAELEEALARHADVTGGPGDATGLAVYRAQHGRAQAMAGLGTMLAFLAGARMKPNAAALRFRQTLKNLAPDGAFAACGDAVAAALVDTGKQEVLVEGARTFCAVETFRTAAARGHDIAQARGVDVDAILARRRWTPPSLVHAAVLQHARRTAAARTGAESAAVRVIELLRALAAPEVAATFRGQAALGAVVAALDESLVAGLGLGTLGLRKTARAALVARGLRFDT